MASAMDCFLAKLRASATAALNGVHAIGDHTEQADLIEVTRNFLIELRADSYLYDECLRLGEHWAAYSTGPNIRPEDYGWRTDLGEEFKEIFGVEYDWELDLSVKEYGCVQLAGLVDRLDTGVKSIFARPITCSDRRKAVLGAVEYLAQRNQDRPFDGRNSHSSVPMVSTPAIAGDECLICVWSQTLERMFPFARVADLPCDAVDELVLELKQWARDRLVFNPYDFSGADVPWLGTVTCLLNRDMEKDWGQHKDCWDETMEFWRKFAHPDHFSQEAYYFDILSVECRKRVNILRRRHDDELKQLSNRALQSAATPSDGGTEPKGTAGELTAIATEQGGKPSKRKSTEHRRNSEELLKAALRKHHQYDNGSVLNFKPISTRQIQTLMDNAISDSTAGRFLKKHFGSAEKYGEACFSGAIKTKLIVLLGDGLHAFGTIDPTDIEDFDSDE